MSFCPNCKYEYEDGIAVCSDCGAYLVDHLEEPPVDGSYVEPVRIITVTTDIEGANVVALLDSCGIQAFTKSKGAGGYLKIYMGSVFYGEVDVYVPADQITQATEALESAGMLGEWVPVPDDYEADQPLEDYQEDLQESREPPLPESLIRRVFRKVALVGVILFALVTLIRAIALIIGILQG